MYGLKGGQGRTPEELKLTAWDAAAIVIFFGLILVGISATGIFE